MAAAASAGDIHSAAEAHGIPAAALAARDALMKQGARRLAAGDADAAAIAFEQAVSMLHAPDAELGLVRSYLQAGRYRQALAYGAHTAGAHREESDGMALYVWLLYMGDQQASARRVLVEAQARAPADAVLAGLQQWMDRGPWHAPVPGAYAQTFAPASRTAALRADLAGAGSGVLIADGARALVPLAAVADRRIIWVRNGLGQTRRATVAGRYVREGLAVLALTEKLPLPAGFGVTGKEPFPGSLAYYAGYAQTGGAQAQSPALRHSFIGPPADGDANRTLSLGLEKGAGGGPVFDAWGALAGMAVAGPAGSEVLLSTAKIRQLLGAPAGPAAAVASGPRVAIERVYENAMQVTLQVLAAR